MLHRKVIGDYQRFYKSYEPIPSLCALFIDYNHRDNGYAQMLIERAKGNARKLRFANLYLYIDLIEYYEKYGSQYTGDGYHPWEKQS